MNKYITVELCRSYGSEEHTFTGSNEVTSIEEYIDDNIAHVVSTVTIELNGQVLYQISYIDYRKNHHSLESFKISVDTMYAFSRLDLLQAEIRVKGMLC